ncbi:uncharacterized protein LOC143854471 isoform X2 [Tasmannia lanceolata]|uniref:uncharacterized protein LOC143854471 isoform X2 n=1 Tax=Tasmannia lanceolata TaxID=3420 RepID=UPI0040648A41
MASGSNPWHILLNDDDYEEEYEELLDRLPIAVRARLDRRPGFAHPPLVQDVDEDTDDDGGEEWSSGGISPNSEQEEEEEGRGGEDNDDSVGNAIATTVDVTDSDSASCTICMEPWSSQGPHRICCLLCGHLYGKSCIQRWIRQCRRNIAKCPQCNEKCKLKDIIDIYAPKVVVVNEDLQKEVFSLRGGNEFLKMQEASLLKEVRLLKKRSMDGELCAKQAACLEDVSLGERIRMRYEFDGDIRGYEESMFLGDSFGSQNSEGRGSSRCSFVLKEEFGVDGARVFDMDASNQIMIVSRRPSGMDGVHVLTKISLLFPYESETISLPSSYRAVRDLCISHNPGRLALLASVGKKLSILSMENNNIVLTYDLPGPAWSCSWDVNSLHHVYAGLQNGMLMVFDLRQTAQPMESLNGLTSHPVHTIHSLVDNGVHSLPYGVRTILSASSIGPCQWNIGVGERPILIPQMENQGICISLACCGSNDDMVATFRPRVQIPVDFEASQPLVSASPTISGPTILGSHVLLKRVGVNSYQNCRFTPSNVSEVRMPKSAIINIEDNNTLFAFGDEITRGLCVRELPSLGVVQHLKPQQSPILDMKYVSSSDSGLLGCISENKLQLFVRSEH